MSSSRNRIVIKCDVEGAEFAILEELVRKGTVCTLVDAGIEFVLLLEIHPFAKESVAPHAPVHALETYLYLIRQCGGKVHSEEGATE